MLTRSEAAAATWTNPDVRERRVAGISEGMKAHRRDPEVKARRKAAVRDRRRMRHLAAIVDHQRKLGASEDAIADLLRSRGASDETIADLRRKK